MTTKDDIGHRLERIETYLQKVATVDDLKGFVTKTDMADMATRDDLKGFVTKADMAHMATKDDLKGFVTKADLAGMPTVDDPKGFVTKADLAGMPTVDDPKGFVTKADLAGMPTVDDPKGFVTKADLDAFGEREGRAMREFVLETIRHSHADLRADIKHDILVLVEAEREHTRMLADGIQAALARIGQVDGDARQRDGVPDAHHARDLPNRL